MKHSLNHFALILLGVENLLDRIERMGMTNPLWVDVTWNAGGSTSDITLDLCSHIQNYSGLDVLMHLTCTYMTREKVLQSLNRVSVAMIVNMLFRQRSLESETFLP